MSSHWGLGDWGESEQCSRRRAHSARAAPRFITHIRRLREIETPLLVPSPGLEIHLEAVAAGGGYLITSPEYQMIRTYFRMLVEEGMPGATGKMKQFASWFTHGVPGGATLRKAVYQAKTEQAILATLSDGTGHVTSEVAKANTAPAATPAKSSIINRYLAVLRQLKLGIFDFFSGGE